MSPGMKVPATILIVVLVSMGAYYAYATMSLPRPATGTMPTSFTVHGVTYWFNYTATNSTEWAKGLMNTRITPSTTMLFAFPYPIEARFWMYDTNTSLDIIWVSASGNLGHVVYIAASAQPCYIEALCATYTPSSPANFVIEAEAGFVEANGISVGTIIRFN